MQRKKMVEERWDSNDVSGNIKIEPSDIYCMEKAIV